MFEVIVPSVSYVRREREVPSLEDAVQWSDLVADGPPLNSEEFSTTDLLRSRGDGDLVSRLIGLGVSERAWEAVGANVRKVAILALRSSGLVDGAIQAMFLAPDERLRVAGLKFLIDAAGEAVKDSTRNEGFTKFFEDSMALASGLRLVEVVTLVLEEARAQTVTAHKNLYANAVWVGQHRDLINAALSLVAGPGCTACLNEDILELSSDQKPRMLACTVVKRALPHLSLRALRAGRLRRRERRVSTAS